MRREISLLILACALPVMATIFATVRGVVHDPAHRPVPDAAVTIKAEYSDWQQKATTNPSGEFEIPSVPLGDYMVEVRAQGFKTAVEHIHVQSGSAPVLHFALAIAASSTTVEVSAAAPAVNPASSTTETTISRQQIAQTPGADRSNSLSMITDYVPGAYIVHDQLHVRGGHQTTWMIDGVPVPNTNIASNVGPQFDPKDIDYLEVQRGGYSADFGDRTYGVFNVVTRSGFERNNEAELIGSLGSFFQTNNQLNFGSHTDRFAYYESVSGNRTNLGLETPTPAVLHDLNSGASGFSSLIFNATPSDQLRMITSVRGDFYQVPNDADAEATGVRDTDHEHDALVNFSWLHTYSPELVLTVSPFYHFNRVQYFGSSADTPVVPFDDRSSNYLGAQVSLAAVKGRNDARAGIYGFAQHDDSSLLLKSSNPASGSLFARERVWGKELVGFVQEQYRVSSWLTFNGGLRATWFSGLLTEHAIDPRVGAALQLPRLHWVLRAFYGRTYQPPPLDTIAGPLIQFAVNQGFGFLPLKGERDEEHEFGIAIPFHGWTADADTFRNGAKNFFDHDVLGNSNVFFPLTIERARIHGWEATLTSPQLRYNSRLHIAWSNQYAEGFGGVSGGLTDFSPPAGGYFFLDHDQRNTVALTASAALPLHSSGSVTVNYGSGFLAGNGPGHLPPHTTADAAISRSFGERLSASATVMNVLNHHYLLDESNTFGGTHYADPRQVIVELRYRFKY